MQSTSATRAQPDRTEGGETPPSHGTCQCRNGCLGRQDTLQRASLLLCKLHNTHRHTHTHHTHSPAGLSHTNVTNRPEGNSPSTTHIAAKRVLYVHCLYGKQRRGPAVKPARPAAGSTSHSLFTWTLGERPGHGDAHVHDAVRRQLRQGGHELLRVQDPTSNIQDDPRPKFQDPRPKVKGEG